MHDEAQRHNSQGMMNRRSFLWLVSAGTAGAVVGCAVNPVTGKKQVMLMSEAQEIGIDQAQSGHQFSADYGTVQDEPLNQYIAAVGRTLAGHTHRPEMPYSFRCVNAAYINAYAFPGGSIATTRGIMLSLGDEAELAALLGHELGHVNARHTAQRMTKGIFLNAAVALGTAYVGQKYEKYADLAAGLGGIGAGMLLAHYSRDDERQADSLGMAYMVKGGYSPDGMVGLMEVLRGMSHSKPNAIEKMFSTHPMSEERYQTALQAAQTQYQDQKNLPKNRDRYMDHTAGLRRKKAAIESLQDGERAMMQKKLPEARSALSSALKKAPRDYCGLVMMAKCQLASEKFGDAIRYAQDAKAVYPKEAQAHHVAGIARLSQKKYEAAFNDFDRYETLLPGNPNTIFFKGIAQDRMDHKEPAAQEYMRYLRIVNQGEQAKHAYDRLKEWGYIKEEESTTQGQNTNTTNTGEKKDKGDIRQ
jgi:predicted Zn-dependent protease